MKLITANKLNRFWKNGVVAKMVAKTKVLKTMEEIAANTNNENIAGAMTVAELSNKLAGQPVWIQDSTGKITGYKTPGGADTVFPFRNLSIKQVLDSATVSAAGNWIGSYTCTEEYKCYFAINAAGTTVTFSNGELLGEGYIIAGNGQSVRYYFISANHGCILSGVSDVWGIL